MPVSVDTVYQRVLALANKEQRGYITPQEFNIFANQAQFEIFEQYFYDQNVREEKKLLLIQIRFIRLLKKNLQYLSELMGQQKF